jgi:hypothetical protein
MFYYSSPTGNYFNYIWYKNTYNITNLTTQDELIKHYILHGHKLDYNPSIYFNTKWYREKYNLNNNICPLEHFCYNINIPDNIKYLPNEKCEYFISFSNLMLNTGFINIKNEFIPLNNQKKRINILLPGFSLSAGPMTAYILASLLYNNNCNIRLISLYASFNSQKVYTELKDRINNFNNNIELESLYDNNILISYDDIFITTAWWTVYPLKFILGFLNYKKFFWIIQENELVIHSCNNEYARALECYNMDYISFINTSILFDDLKTIKLGNFGNNDYVLNNCICFEPAFDKNLFYYENHDNKKIKIIFYSRGSNIAERNLYELCINLLKTAVDNNIINNDNFEIISFGDNNTPSINLGKNIITKNVGFLNLIDYAKLIRSADILISFQLAPHPSYPPLEISYCNGICLHTNFSYKNQSSILRYTDKIIMCEPNINSLIIGINNCINIIKKKNLNYQPLLLNNNWEIALDTCINKIINQYM